MIFTDFNYCVLPKVAFISPNKSQYYKIIFSQHILCFISEPFRTLISESGHLAEFMQSQIVSGEEQDYLPKDKGM